MPREPERKIHRFPFKGINVDFPQTDQPPDTCVDCQNVRVHDSISQRQRGGMRPGISRYVNTQFDGSNPIQNINYVATVANTSPSSNTLSYRTVNSATVSNGKIFKFTSTTATAATTTGARSLDNTVPFIFSTGLFGKIYYVDGTSYKIWVAGNNTTTDWTLDKGSLPGTDGTVAPRLITTWRGRIVLSGLRTDPHNWFMSKLGDPLDFDYAPANTNATQAIQGGIGNIGKIPDVINCLLPYSEDVLILGCDHSIYQMTGDPQRGGQIDLISNTVGMAFGQPYCQDPQGNIYFFSSRGNVYVMQAGGRAPESLTEDSIYNLVANTDLDTTHVTMEWDEEQKGMYLFLTPFDSGNTDHWFWDSVTQGWFKDRFADNDIGPTAIKTFDGDDPDDRVILLGGRDSRIRQIDTDAADDDGTNMVSFVIIGPDKAAEGTKPMVLTEIQALTDSTSSTIKYEILADDIPDDALDRATAGFDGDGTWEAGMSVTRNPRIRGFYIYYKVGTTDKSTPWSLERLYTKTSTIGRSRGRARQFDDMTWFPQTEQPPVVVGEESPTGNTNPFAVFDPGTGVTTNASNTDIESWDSFSGVDITLTSAPSPPTLISQDTLFNGRPSVSVSGNSAATSLGSSLDFDDLESVSNGSFIFPFYLTADTPNNMLTKLKILLARGSTDGVSLDSFQVQVAGNSTNTIWELRERDGEDLSTVSVTLNTTTVNTPVIVTFAHTGSERKLRINGTEQISNSSTRWFNGLTSSVEIGYPTTQNSDKDYRLGTLDWRNTYNLSEIQEVENALASYYGITF